MDTSRRVACFLVRVATMADGNVTPQEMYDRLDDIRKELVGKLDSISDDMKEFTHSGARRDLKLQELEIWQKNRDLDLENKLDQRFDEHLAEDHNGLIQLGARVWVMWGVGIFLIALIAEEFARYGIGRILGF